MHDLQGVYRIGVRSLRDMLFLWERVHEVRPLRRVDMQDVRSRTRPSGTEAASSRGLAGREPWGSRTRRRAEQRGVSPHAVLPGHPMEEREPKQDAEPEARLRS